MKRADRLDAGLVCHDSELGWRLVPNWRGRHHHPDFAVEYKINAHGFRADADWNVLPPAKQILVVGDSFTFGIGVNDDETFVHYLNELAPERHLNCGVPGYSTDQEVLLAERDLLQRAPACLRLVVHLGNDVFDNRLTVPMQVRAAKPWFELVRDELLLCGVPVPYAVRHDAPRPTLAGVVLGESLRTSWRGRAEQRSALIRMLAGSWLPEPGLPADFGPRMEPSIALTVRLIERLRMSCHAAGAEFAVVLLAGRSFVEAPLSLSGQYQDYLRRELTAGLAAAGISTMDLAVRLQQRHQLAGGRWFHLRDGHLNADGHRIVAEILTSAIARREVADDALPATFSTRLPVSGLN